MWSTPAACMVCILFGIICEVKQVYSQPKLIKRKTDQTPDEATKLEENIQKVINQIHSLSGENENIRSFSFSTPGQGFDLNAYYSTLTNLFAAFQPLLRNRFIDDFPKTLVCILSGRQDCGLEAELTKTVSLELGKPLLTFVSSLRSQTCTPLNSDGESNSFLRTYLSIGQSMTAALNGFQQTFVNTLSSLPLSGNLISAVSGLVDAAVIYVSKFMATLLQAPMDYIKIALQFGIRIPSLDGKETCEQGDLKQLIMWGINHNVSWSFGNSIIDILLEIFLAPEQSLCTYPGPKCQNPPSVPFQRSVSEAKDDTDNNHDILLRCDRHNLARLNDTLCADILTASRAGSSTSVLTFCQALSSLSPNQIEQVWNNMCYVIQALVSPFLSRSSDCSFGDIQPSPAVTPPSESLPLPHSAPPQVAREASNLKQLACNYNSWLGNKVDAVLVSLCSDNEREEFVKQVCNNALLMRELLSDQMNRWLYGYCANSSADPGYMVSQFCIYEQWIKQSSIPADPSLLEFCMSLDSPRLTKLICEHIGFFMLLFSNPENGRFMPNCTNLPPPPPFPDMGSLILDSCRYSEWHDVMQITIDVLSLCIRLDQSGFTKEVCSNKTFLNSLLRNKANTWLEIHCNTSLSLLPPEPTQSFNIAGWCDYHTWGERHVDDSVVGLCWQHDQLAFEKNVCCKVSLFEKLLQNPQNKWLISVCTDIEEIALLPQVCKYSEWTRPIIVDMTELALCAEIDPLNFTSKVCANNTVLQNLLANQDNTWLLQHCANHSNPGLSPGGGHGEGLTGFNPTEQCQYSSWSISLPDAALLTLCWERDQTHFVSSICPNAGLLFLLSREPSSVWVGSMCNTYTNFTTTTSTNNSTTAEPNFCLARNLVRQFNWTCSAVLNSACQPGANQNMALQMLVRCWVESLRSRVEDLLTPPVATVVEQAMSTTVVILLALEEVQNTSLHVTENIRLSMLASVVRYLERENNFDKKRVLLQCFGRVLTSLMQTARDVTSDEFFVIKEYFSIPLSSLRSVLSAAHITTIRLILQYYSRNKDALQLHDNYLSTMVSVLFQTHLVKDGSLFSELAPLLAAASLADIKALPSLQNNINVREAINRNLGSMTLDQRRAFGLWYSKVMPPSNITRGHQSLIRDAGNLITYLPFHNFQHLSPAQLLDGLDVLQRNTLTSLKQEFIAHSLIGTYRNLTAQDVTRLGKLSCLADPEDLLVYKGTEAFSVIRDIIMNCTREGLSLPSHLISSLLLNSTELKVPSTLSSDRLAELSHLLPLLGVPFLQGLTPSQLLAVFPALDSVSFSPAQASIIVDKLSSIITLTAPGQLQELGSLIVGVKTETLLTLTSDRLLSSLPAMAQHTQGLSPPQANAVSTKLWGFPEVVGWLDDVEPLLSCTPLLSVLPRTRLLVNNITTASTKPWNTQQAKAIFKEVIDSKPNLINLGFLSLGTVGQGVSCKVLQERFRADSSPPSVRRILAFLRQQPRPLHTSLKKCVIEELYQFEFFSELLKDLGAEIALSMPVSTVKKFPTDMMDVLRKMIIQDPHHFLLLSRTKQELLVDKIVQRMGMYTGVFTEEEFRSLGIMAPFVVDEVFIQLDRSFFIDNLDFLQGLCYSSSKIDIVARILQEPAAFGPMKNWNQTTLSQVDRFLFFLPDNKLQEISLALMTVGRIEKLFMSQRRWERGDVGIHCADENERSRFFEKQQFVLQFFLGFLKINPVSPTPMVPTCEILRTTAPSAWTSNSLTSMSSSAFSNCLELMGHDPFLAPYQRSQVLKKVKQIYGSVSSFTQSVISQLGGIAIELSIEELSSLRLTERRSIAAMGAISAWSNRQLAALFTTVLNSTKQSPSQLDSSTLVAMGYFVCGAKTTEMNSFNAVEFSKAVLWLGQLRLSCSEEQLLVLIGLLTHRLAFGPISSWGTDVFIEIGVLAAGLPDIAMSALVKEQIEGITPVAISMIPPDKFAVVFHQRQISMFSYEQAAAVTDEQLSALSDVQRTALAMVLTPWEDRPVDFRGKSLGLALSHSPLCLILGLLMLPIVLPYPGT
ncbi:stereocilin [Siniperca chuatsi]|uniref:stereocilin n=1 Tax=Siniperca chuatsi TaxID=119488 RepID=UPI001CE0583A|nr:stereocilin [Siniperca chuatsi]